MSIDLQSLPIYQLSEIGKQLDQDIQLLTQSFASLKQAQIKFHENIDLLATKDCTGQIPLTNSLYVPANISPQVMVDIGTGYYVCKSTKDAISFYSKKAAFVKENLESLSKNVNERQNQKQILVQVMQQKLASMRNKE
jgi:prefoldin alpha subunit